MEMVHIMKMSDRRCVVKWWMKSHQQRAAQANNTREIITQQLMGFNGKHVSLLPHLKKWCSPSSRLYMNLHSLGNYLQPIRSHFHLYVGWFICLFVNLLIGFHKKHLTNWHTMWFRDYGEWTKDLYSAVDILEGTDAGLSFTVWEYGGPESYTHCNLKKKHMQIDDDLFCAFVTLRVFSWRSWKAANSVDAWHK